MIVHLTTHLEAAHNEFEMLQRIINVIHERGHSLLKNWIEPQYFQYTNPNQKYDEPEWDIICRETIPMIEKADVLIAEASDYGSFGVGYQVAIAQLKDKPVLILTKSSPPYGAYIDGLNFGKLRRQEYNSQNLESKIIDFLQLYEK